ncbi:HET-domain-containing protein [Polyplosphaeria fusca]|uniref:HET-domain-containing protein n=1 Tax=Polyplosphaeria fusca TaxID=682080 RepID=A0A9P4QYX0_9PLEO|nr:HET-domain-containing protein [Polyplosphaeria fusca]
MWLLKINGPKDYDIELVGPYYDTKRPPYIILSHTWSQVPGEELTYQDMKRIQTLFAKRYAPDPEAQQELTAYTQRAGWTKIRSCCASALADGFEYAWVDTVCIDKTSSAELSEAINSMYRWYQQALRCFVFLEDIHSTNIQDMQHCRWFSRGWTLQELLAPKHVLFYNSDWHLIGWLREETMCRTLESITKIDYAYLSGYASIRRASVACRMSWASKRVTTRVEDLAYCLLGIFGIHMPLLYGEGNRAFIRLQEEICHTSEDQSIFAWQQTPFLGTTDNVGLLAPSPVCFQKSSELVPMAKHDDKFGFSLTKGRVQFRTITDQKKRYLVLRCRTRSNYHICILNIYRLRSAEEEYVRRSSLHSITYSDFVLRYGKNQAEQISLLSHIGENFEHDNSIKYIEIKDVPTQNSGYRLKQCWPSMSYDWVQAIITVSLFRDFTSLSALYFQHDKNASPDFLAVFSADGPEDGPGLEWDSVHVYANLSIQAFKEAYKNEVLGSNVGELSSALDKVPGLANKVHLRGEEVWDIGGGAHVKVCVSRDHKLLRDSIAAAGIFAGSDWADVARNLDEFRINPSP